MSESVWGFINEPSKGSAPGPGDYEVDEVTITFAETVPAGTVINIQTGSYPGQVLPPTVFGDSITLPASAALFNEEGRIEVSLNGVEQAKGSKVNWLSTTQVTLSKTLYDCNKLTIRSPA